MHWDTVSSQRLHPCDWENGSRFSNLWCGEKEETGSPGSYSVRIEEGWRSGWRGYSYLWRRFAFWPLDRFSSHLPSHIFVTLSPSHNVLDPITSTTQLSQPLCSRSGTQTCKLTSIQQELAVCLHSPLLQHHSQITQRSSLEVTWVPRFHLNASITKQKTNPPPSFWQWTLGGSVGGDSTDLHFCTLSTLPIHSHSTSPQKTFYTVTNKYCSLHSLGSAESHKLSYSKILKEPANLLSQPTVQDLPLSS